MSEMDLPAELRAVACRCFATLDDEAVAAGIRLHEMADEAERRAQQRVAQGARFRARQRRQPGLVRVALRLRDLISGVA